jgi:hypothetical protein
MALSKINTNSIADDAVTTAKVNPAQTDITSVGTLSSLGVTGTTKLGEIASIGQATPLSPNDATSFLHIGDNNNQDTSIILEDAVEIWEIYQNDTLSFRKDTTIVQELHRDGYVTQPLQPAFSAYLNSSQNDIAANNSFVTVNFDTEVFDQNADYNTSTYTFTAPVTGKYQFNASVSLNNLDSSSNYAFISVGTSNRSYYNYIGANHMDQDDRVLLPISILADMDASDTAKINILINTGTAQADIATGGVVSHFSGYLVC